MFTRVQKRYKKVKATFAAPPEQAGRSPPSTSIPCLPQLPKDMLCPRQNFPPGSQERVKRKLNCLTHVYTPQES